MSNIHLILQGKGGVGKSLIASLIAQHCYAKKKDTLCIDTDPVNATLFGFAKLNVQQINLMEDDEINSRNFDGLIELIDTSKADVVIDNGASSFVSLSHYLLSNNIPSLLADMGHNLVVHTVITGSQALPDTVNGFKQMVTQFPKNVFFIVWLNPFWGKVEINGKSFESMKAYVDNKDRVSAIIHIPEYKKDTFGVDISEMLKKKLTFDEVLADPQASIMKRQRLKMVKKELFVQIDNALSTLS